MTTSADPRTTVRKVFSIVLTAAIAALLVVCLFTMIMELLSGADIGRLGKSGDIIYTDLVINFGLLALYAFTGIVLSAVLIRLESARWSVLCGKIGMILFALSPCVLLFCI